QDDALRPDLAMDHVPGGAGLPHVLGARVPPPPARARRRQARMIDLFRRAGLRLQRQKNVYRIALVACVVFQALHLLALPLVMSPDGLEYVALSERFGSAG